MIWDVIVILAAVVAIFMSGFWFRGNNKVLLALMLGLGLALLIIVGNDLITKTKFDGYTSATPEPAVYSVISVHELSEEEILVGVHLDDSSYKRVFQLKKEWFLDEDIPPAPEHFIVSKGDEGQLILVLR